MGSQGLALKMASRAILLLSVVIAIIQSTQAGEVVHLSAVLNGNGNNGISIEKGLLRGGNVVSQAIFENAINETGLSYLEIIAEEADIPDESRAYGARIMEGFATAELIYQHFMNQFATYCEGDGMSQVCELTEKYLEENSEWIMAQLEEQRQASDGGIGDPYWYQVN